MIEQKQNGYAMLWMLAWLGASSMALGALHHQVGAVGAWESGWRAAYELSLERERLVHYSIDYGNLYGAGGAGPGHLPCPNTNAAWQRPGPNPPCGHGLSVSGKLPNGVTRPRGRIALSDALHISSNYSVSNAVVNNPAQAVGAALWPKHHTFANGARAYAMIWRSLDHYRLIQQSALKPITQLWVQAWLVESMLLKPLQDCSRRINDASSFAQIPRSEQVVIECPSRINIFTKETGLAASPLRLATCTGEVLLCEVRGAQLLSWLLAGEQPDWDGVPVSRHWFVANGWLNTTVLSAHTLCMQREVACAVTLNQDSDQLQLTWLPAVLAGSDAAR